MQIYICDDDALDTARLCRMVKKYAQNFGCAPAIKAFSGSEQLLSALESGAPKPDLLFLDVYMSGMDGVQTLERLRTRYQTVPVIFSTSSEDHAIEAFRLHAVGYLRKPYTQQDFDHALRRVERLFTLSGRTAEIWVPEQESRQSIHLEDIYYIESAGRRALLHIGGESSRTGVCARLRSSGALEGNVCAVNSRLSMQEYRARLAGEPDFCECGRFYIINMNHAAELTGHELRMEDGDILHVPERQRSALVQALEKWRRQNGNLPL